MVLLSTENGMPSGDMGGEHSTANYGAEETFGMEVGVDRSPCRTVTNRLESFLVAGEVQVAAQFQRFTR